MSDIIFNAELRTEQGSKPAGRLRRAGLIPGAIKRLNNECTLITLNAHAYMMTMRKHKADQLLATIDLGGEQFVAILREVQHNVITGAPIHVDFGEIDITKPTRVAVQIHLVGENEAIKTNTARLEQLMRVIHVECLPHDIVESFDVDISGMTIEHSLTVAKLNFGEKYRITTPAKVAVAALIELEAEPEAPVVAPTKGKK